MKTIIQLSLICLLLATSPVKAEMQLYDVNFQYRHEVYEALRAILESDQAGKENYGKVELLPTGQILVDAPDQTQQQVARVIAAIDQHDNEPPPSVTLKYWVVYGGGSGNGTSSAVLKNLKPVLDDLRKIYGDINFQVLDSLSLVSETGSRAHLSGRRLRVEQRIHFNENQINANIELAYHGPEPQNLGVKVSLKRGEFLVLGESTIQDQDTVGQMFYVVSWP